jgi:hypothetical protein
MESDRVNAKECMQALVKGKTLRRFDVFIKLDEDGDISINGETPDYRDLGKLNFNAPFWEVTEEFPLTFKEAMQEAINGRKIAHETYYKDIFFFDKKGCLRCNHETYGEGFVSFSDEHVTGKWRVVE